MHIPIFDFKVEKSSLDFVNWSSNLTIGIGLAVSANYFNMTNSNWEPFVESWKLNLSAKRELESKKLLVDVNCREKLELNLSHVFIETLMSSLAEFQQEKVACLLIQEKTKRQA